jgi:immune inhibitor A
MNAWDKFQLGWLNYEVAFAGQTSSHKLGPSVFNTKQAQGLFVVLPESANPTTTVLGTPTSGANAWYSTAGNDLDLTMAHAVTIPAASSVQLSMNVWYEIETCWDYAYVRVSTDGGATYTNVHTSVSDSGNENSQNLGEGITGISGAPKQCDVASGSPSWVPLTADLTAYAGKTVTLQIRYKTDPAAGGRGFEFDDLAVTADGSTVFSEDAEAGDNGWTIDGFRRTSGADVLYSPHYYVVENRQYGGDYDSGLKTGPYQFGFLDQADKQNLVEHFPYQDGVLISYWDTSFGDNNVGDHPGEGQILPIDARPAPLHWSDGSLMRPRLQSFDATFGLSPTDAITLHNNSQATSIPSQPAIPVFDDMNSYWVDGDPADAPGNGRYQAEWNSVNTPHTGTQVRVVGQTKDGFVQVQVRPSK